jgi:hypothetical protein
MKKNLLRIFLFLFTSLNAQEYQSVIDETIVVNSITAITGYTRNITEIALPEHTVSYIYRITITLKGSPDKSTPLLSFINNSSDIGLAGVSRLSQYAIKNNDNSAVDAFIFNNVYDANDFYSKNDGNWAACKSMANRTNCCFESTECINSRVFFGFRNNNVAQGLNVRLEVIAKVDDSADRKCSYTISNATNMELKYYVSVDNVNWEESTLRSGYHMTYNNSFKELYFKINSTNSAFVNYKIFPNERYKIVLNSEKSIWDLIRY